MNKKQRAIIEKNSEVLEEKNLNYKKFWGWGVGLILVLMAIAYFAGLILLLAFLKKPQKPKEKPISIKIRLQKQLLPKWIAQKNKKEAN